MKIKQYVAFALMGLALGACKRPGGEGPDVVEPERKLVKASLAIKMPKSIRTYAPGADDLLATEEEIIANQIDVFIYDDGGSYAVTHYPFEPNGGSSGPTTGARSDGEFGLNGTEDAFVTADFDVREGPKLVYVGINLPDFIVDRLSTGYYVNEVFEREDLIDLLATAAVAGGSAEVAFFNTAIKSVDFTDDSDGTPIDVSVSRLVAKVVVKTDGGSAAFWDDISGGRISDLKFAIGQRNNQMYVSPLTGGTLVPGPPIEGAGEDPNYSDGTIATVEAASINGIQKLQFVRDADYIDVNDLTANANDGANTNMRYTTENTSENYWHQHVTYVSIKAKFAPHRFGADPDTGELPDNGSPNNTTPPADGFYAVFTGDPTGEDALGVRYFDGEGDLEVALEDARNFVEGAYFSAKAPALTTRDVDEYKEDATNTNTDHYIFFYDESNCYYRIYLNPNLTSGGGVGTGRGDYNILRNTVYIATISGVNYIGTTKPNSLPGSYENHLTNAGRGTPTWPGAWFPNPLPHTPVDPATSIDPLDLFTGFDMEITLDDWDDDDQEYDVY